MNFNLSTAIYTGSQCSPGWTNIVQFQVYPKESCFTIFLSYYVIFILWNYIHLNYSNSDRASSSQFSDKIEKMSLEYDISYQYLA